MMYCNKCKVSVQGSPRRCPLCHGVLTGEAEPAEDVFPEIPPERTFFRRLVAILAFSSIAAAVVVAGINIALSLDGVWWFPFIIAGLGSLWISFLIMIKQWRNIPKTIFRQLLVSSTMVLLWDIFTGFHKWSLNFVIPFLFSGSMIFLSIFAKVRRLKGEDYILFLGFISVVSIFSLLFIIFHVVTTVYPVMICFSLSIISLAFLLLFEGRPLRAELQRRMHM
jgi:hypothetical protein